jgi:hypothetical protein
MGSHLTIYFMKLFTSCIHRILLNQFDVSPPPARGSCYHGPREGRKGVEVEIEDDPPGPPQKPRGSRNEGEAGRRQLGSERSWEHCERRKVAGSEWGYKNEGRE